MAKFAIALCILLVTYGAQGASLLSLLSAGSSALSSVVSTNTGILTNLIDAATSGKTVSSAIPTISNAVTSTSSTSADTVVADIVDATSNTASSLASNITKATTTLNSILAGLNSLQTDWITQFSTAAKTASAILTSSVLYGLNVIDSSEAAVNTTVTAMLEESNTLMNTLSSTEIDVSSCVSVISEGQVIAAGALAAPTKCIAEYVVKLQSDFDKTITELSAFLDKLDNLEKQILSCQSTVLGSVACDLQSVATLSPSIALELTGLITKVGLLVEEVSTVQATIATCSLNEVVQVVRSKLISLILEAADCAKALAQAALSGAGFEDASETLLTIASTAESTASEVLSRVASAV